MSATESVAEKVKELSEDEAKAVLAYIAKVFPARGHEGDAERQLETACLAANNDPALTREISDWQNFHDALPE